MKLPHFRIAAIAILLFAFGSAGSAPAEPTAARLLRTIPNPGTVGEQHGFGSSVAVSGNWMVVGCQQANPMMIYGEPQIDPGAGIAYVFDSRTGKLTATLNNPEPAAGDYFGWPVSISSDMIVVGAMKDDPGGVPDAGTAIKAKRTFVMKPAVKSSGRTNVRSVSS